MALTKKEKRNVAIGVGAAALAGGALYLATREEEKPKEEETEPVPPPAGVGVGQVVEESTLTVRGEEVAYRILFDEVEGVYTGEIYFPEESAWVSGPMSPDIDVVRDGLLEFAENLIAPLVLEGIPVKPTMPGTVQPPSPTYKIIPIPTKPDAPPKVKVLGGVLPKDLGAQICDGKDGIHPQAYANLRIPKKRHASWGPGIPLICVAFVEPNQGLGLPGGFYLALKSQNRSEYLVYGPFLQLTKKKKKKKGFLEKYWDKVFGDDKKKRPTANVQTSLKKLLKMPYVDAKMYAIDV